MKNMRVTIILLILIACLVTFRVADYSLPQNADEITQAAVYTNHTVLNWQYAFSDEELEEIFAICAELELSYDWIHSHKPHPVEAKYWTRFHWTKDNDEKFTVCYADLYEDGRVHIQVDDKVRCFDADQESYAKLMEYLENLDYEFRRSNGEVVKYKDIEPSRR